MKFTMDGGLSAYDYKAEEDEPEDTTNFKALAGSFSLNSTRHHAHVSMLHTSADIGNTSSC